MFESFQSKKESQPASAVLLAVCTAGVLAWGAFAFWLVFIGPKFVEIFRQLQVELPAPTALTLTLIQANILIAPLVLITAVLCAWFVWSRRATRLGLYLLLAGIVSTVIAHGSMAMPIAKIQEALKRQH